MKKFNLLFLVIVSILVGANHVMAERLSVTVNIANVRSAPGTDGVVMWQVEKFYPLQIIEKKGPWYLFEDFEKDRGWIHSSLVADIRAVIVKKDNCNVRSGPGTDYEIRFTVDRGVPFRVMEEKGKWLHVIHADGDQGWLHRSLVW